jgi:hypothetical protein
MAFDHADTDALFANIERELFKMQIRAIRIDRLNYNDDIDNKIIAEIGEADFAIADLTYARPSVYFEAGFAQRAVPVIYIVRSDHFKAKADDPYGNSRVHFDLQMKNIVAWKTATDRAFAEKLKARVAKVAAPLFRRRQAEDESRQNLASFAAKSLQERQEHLKGTLRDYFVRQKYRVTDLRQAVNEKDFWRLGNLQGSGAVGGICAKQRVDAFEFVFYHVVPSITKGLSQLYGIILLRQQPYPHAMATSYGGRQRTPRQLSEEIVICSFGTRGAARVARELPFLRPAGTDGTLEMITTAEVVQPGRSTEVPRRVKVHIIESNAQLANLGNRLDLRCQAASSR